VPPDDLDFGVLLALSYGAFVAEMRAQLAESGYPDLHRSFGYVARALAERPLTLRELSERLDITSQGALKIVDELERTGYLERAADTADRRAKRLVLTKRGKAALAAARAFHRRFEHELARRLGARSAAACRGVLEGIVARRQLSGSPVVLRPV
jgi:DNA-binding MarR family transcriptional regulator